MRYRLKYKIIFKNKRTRLLEYVYNISGNETPDILKNIISERFDTDNVDKLEFVSLKEDNTPKITREFVSKQFSIIESAHSTIEQIENAKDALRQKVFQYNPDFDDDFLSDLISYAEARKSISNECIDELIESFDYNYV